MWQLARWALAIISIVVIIYNEKKSPSWILLEPYFRRQELAAAEVAEKKVVLGETLPPQSPQEFEKLG